MLSKVVTILRVLEFMFFAYKQTLSFFFHTHMFVEEKINKADSGGMGV